MAKCRQAVTAITCKYMKDIVSLEECCTESRAYTLPSRLTNPPPDWRQWEVCRADHSDNSYCNYIINGIRDSFCIGFDYNQASQLQRAHTSSNNMQINPRSSRGIWQKNVVEKGPLDRAQYPGYLSTQIALGSFPKASPGNNDSSSISAPEGASANDGVSKSLFSFYVGVQDAIEGIQQHGPRALLAEIDIRSAYQHVLIQII